MGSFFGLVKNEYIKIYRKRSTRIMLVIFLAVVLCFPPLAKFCQYYVAGQFEPWDEAAHMADMIDRFRGDIEDDEDDPLAQYKLEFLDAVDVSEGWQSGLVYTARSSEDKQEIQRLTMLCKMDDWRGYCKYSAENAFDEGERWEFNYRLEHDIGFGEEFEKQNDVIDKVASAMGGYADEWSGSSASDQIAIGLYQLENEIYDNTSDKGGSLLNVDFDREFEFWDIYMKTPFIVPGIGLIMLVIAGSCVSSEFSQGTIKFLLINPVKRWKILMAKYVTVMSLGFLLIIVMMTLSIPVTGICFGFDGITAPYLSVKDGEVIIQSSFIYLFKSYMLASVQMVVTTTLALTISSLLRSSSLAIVAGILVNSIGSTVINAMALWKMDWGRYLIFANTDLLAISNGQSVFPQHTVGFALAVIAVHMVVFLLTAWDGFTRRSV